MKSNFSYWNFKNSWLVSEAPTTLFFLVLVLCFGEALAHLLQGLSCCCMALLWWVLISVPVAFLSCSLPVLLWPLTSTRHFHQTNCRSLDIFVSIFGKFHRQPSVKIPIDRQFVESSNQPVQPSTSHQAKFKVKILSDASLWTSARRLHHVHMHVYLIAAMQ